ncbi:hypothetical protein AAHE18_03G169000 [Arachis hypogaea]
MLLRRKSRRKQLAPSSKLKRKHNAAIKRIKQSLRKPENLMSWMTKFDDSSGYYYHKTNGFCYDPKSGFYYSDAIGKWVTQEEAYASPQFSSNAGISGSNSKSLSTSQSKSIEKKTENKSQNGPSPGPIVSSSLNPKRNVKGAPSSLTVGKRKRPEEKSKAKVISEEEKAALKAREAARKRVEEREKSLLGLYGKPY